MPKPLNEAVANWLRAEWMLRCGPNAFCSVEFDWFEKACRKLRRALTGRGDLEEAYKALNDPPVEDRGERKDLT